MSLPHQLLRHLALEVAHLNGLMHTWNVSEQVIDIESIYQMNVDYATTFLFVQLLQGAVIWFYVLGVLSNLWANSFLAQYVARLFKK